MCRASCFSCLRKLLHIVQCASPPMRPVVQKDAIALSLDATTDRDDAIIAIFTFLIHTALSLSCQRYLLHLSRHIYSKLHFHHTCSVVPRSDTNFYASLCTIMLNDSVFFAPLRSGSWGYRRVRS